MRKITMSLVALAADAKLEVCAKLGKLTAKSFHFLAMAIFFTAMAVSANAVTLVVTNTNDSGAGSLRQAVLDAEANNTSDIIQFDPAFFNVPRTITLTSGQINVTSSLAIFGQTAKSLTISGNNQSRIFFLSGTGLLSLESMNLTNGRAPFPNDSKGGAIFQFGSLTTLSLNGVTVYNNSARAGGAGINSEGGNLGIQNSTIVNNAIESQFGGSGGGIVANSNSQCQISDSTIAFNSAGNLGGGFWTNGNGCQITRTIIAKNTSPNAPDYSGNLQSVGNNLIGNTSGATIPAPSQTDLIGVEPSLLPLSDNGGNTLTCALDYMSPAIDHIQENASSLEVDQRGFRRDIPIFNSGGRSDIGAFEKQKTNFDFNGDGKADQAIARNNNLIDRGENDQNGINGVPVTWWIKTAEKEYSVQWGLSTDKLVPADYDGDGKTDQAVFRPSNCYWFINGSKDGFIAINWGLATDIPVPGEYDGDGKADIAVYRNGIWYIFGSNSQNLIAYNTGSGSNIPVPAALNSGGGSLNPNVFNQGFWQFISNNSGNFTFGQAGDIPVPLNYEQVDGAANLAVFRPSDNTWYVKETNSANFSGTQFGLAGDKLVPADYDGDGKADISVYRNGTWWIKGSTAGIYAVNWGLTNDRPIPNLYIPQLF